MTIPQKTGNKAKLRAPVNVMCKQCIYDPSQEGTWRKQVENCTSRDCALYRVRPLSTGGVI